MPDKISEVPIKPGKLLETPEAFRKSVEKLDESTNQIIGRRR